MLFFRSRLVRKCVTNSYGRKAAFSNGWEYNKPSYQFRGELL
jgi:hypothetical protein